MGQTNAPRAQPGANHLFGGNTFLKKKIINGILDRNPLTIYQPDFEESHEEKNEKTKD
jgi:hypothetical protein